MAADYPSCPVPRRYTLHFDKLNATFRDIKTTMEGSDPAAADNPFKTFLREYNIQEEMPEAYQCVCPQ